MVVIQGRAHQAQKCLLVGIAAAVLGAGLSACGAGENGSEGSGSDASVDVSAAAKGVEAVVNPPTSISQDVPLAGAIPEDKTVVFANSGLPATGLIAGGVKEAVEAIGWTYDSVSYDQTNPASLQGALQSALTKGADAVIIAGNPPATFGKKTIAAFEKAGVPIVVGSVCPVEAGGAITAGSLGCEQEDAAGRALADWFISDSAGKGKALFQNVPAIPSLLAFVEAFEDEVDKKCSSCSVKVVKTTLEQVGQNQIVPTVVNTLRSDTSINYLFFDNAQWSKGIGPALEAAGLEDKVKIGGRSMDEGALGALQKGTQSAWTATAYNVGGYGNVDALLRLMTKSEGAENVEVLPFQIVTPETTSGLSAPYRFPADALDQYLKLWEAS
ncbi:MAG: substrate-binding domain-containing protein [Aeromicrobium sp.]